MKTTQLLFIVTCILITIPALASEFAKEVVTGESQFWGWPDKEAAEKAPLCSKDGINIHYYPNNQIHIEAACENGELHGFYKEYSETGLLKSKQNYTHGILDGSVKTYHPNGELAQVQNFNKGKAEGSPRSFDTTGKYIPSIEEEPESYIQVHDYIMTHKDLIKKKKRGLWSQSKSQTPKPFKIETTEKEEEKESQPQYEAYYINQ